LIRVSQYTQAEGLRYAAEANLRRQYQSSGTLPWQFNEPYPNAFCTSAVDYYAQPKAVYYTLARAYSPVQISARFDSQSWQGRDLFESEIWTVNSRETEYAAEAVIRLYDAEGVLLAGETARVIVNGNGSRRAVSFSARLTDLQTELFVLDLALIGEQGDALASNRYLFSSRDNLRPMLDAPHTALHVETKKEQDGWELTIRNDGAFAALNVRVEDNRGNEPAGYVYFDDNYFSLLPGESRSIAARWEEAAIQDKQLALAGWNTETILI
jgi:beta-mannosidase